MKYAFFQGCNIPIRIQQYATSTTAILQQFDIDLEVIPEFNCCGYPARNVDEKAYLLPSVRNLAIAEKKGLDILVICNCCFASLQKARNVMSKDKALLGEMNAILAKENLNYSGTAEVKHYLTVLYEQVGPETLKRQMVKMFTTLNIAVIHGCHILRPREITNFDDSFIPEITEELLLTTGATSLDWRGKLECCGAALAGLNNDLSQKLLKEKISGAQEAGADFVTPICSYCHLQFDTMQINMLNANPAPELLPVLLLPQLIGLCLGLDEETLGITRNRTIAQNNIEHINSLLGPPKEEKKKKKARAAA
jgi:heterodisulfide reductase subunit B